MFHSLGIGFTAHSKKLERDFHRVSLVGGNLQQLRHSVFLFCRLAIRDAGGCRELFFEFGNLDELFRHGKVGAALLGTGIFQLGSQALVLGLQSLDFFFANLNLPIRSW